MNRDRQPLRPMQPTSVTVTKIKPSKNTKGKAPHPKALRSSSTGGIKVQTTSNSAFDFDINSYHRIHRTDNSDYAQTLTKNTEFKQKQKTEFQ